MVADPPSIILAMETGMKPLDFYCFLGKIGLGTITLVAVLVALSTLLVQFRWMNKGVEVQRESIPATKGASVLFIVGVAALMVGPEFGLRPGVVGFAAGLIALYMGRSELGEMLVEFDWNSFLFIVGIFMVIYTLTLSGLLDDFGRWVVHSGLTHPTAMLALVTWLSVALSSFMDNVPYTILMIPVCKSLAASLGIVAWPLLYGMLVGTGIGGNVTPVGATANVFACGILEKHFLKGETILILAFGLLAICLDTVCGVLFGKLMSAMTGGKINPLIGAAGISAYPMAARVAQREGKRYDRQNFLLMHAVGANTGGQVGSVMAAAIMLSVLHGMGVIN
jgi:Na+/H+ antiporter NhaD/arsenite permease-like protein